MNMSFREKSIWVMSAGLLLASVIYAYAVSSVNQAMQSDVAWQAMRILPPMVFLFAVAVGLLTVFAVIAHVVLAVADPKGGEDERDRKIALKGAQWGGVVLAVGVFCALCVAVLSAGNFWFSHVLLGFWVLAQLAEYLTQIVLYRCGG